MMKKNKMWFFFYLKQHSKNAIKHSTPEVKEGERGEVRATIFGAPCNVYPPFSSKELKQDFLGCQALPTALWIKKLLSSSEETEFGQDYANEPWVWCWDHVTLHVRWAEVQSA